MEVTFAVSDLEELATGDERDAGFPLAVVKAYRMRVQFIRCALDERDFYAMKSWRFEKLKGNRGHQCSIRLNDQWRLIVELDGKGADKIVVVKSIEDYHS